MEKLKDNYKIILACNKDGMVNQIFLDTGSLLENIKLPIGLHTIVSPISIRELGSFWNTIQEKSMEENIVLTLSHNDKQQNYIFSGYLLKDTILLCGNTELTSTEKVLEEIMLINNEQANQIRLTEKKVVNVLKEIEGMEMNEALLNEFSTLNNELINNQRELMSKNQKIELLNKELNAVNENLRMFTYSVSHDLNEPVRMVRSFLTLIQNKYGENLGQKGQTYIDMALEGANKLSKMLTDLLAYHQSSNYSNTEIVDLNEVFLEVKQILQSVIEVKNATVTSERLPIAMGSFAGYRQVIQNLVANAIKFVAEGVAPVVSIHVQENDTYYTIVVKDNGIGIPEGQNQKIFNLFSRLNSTKQYEGTGMGLAMVKKTVERMGGEIWLESEEGKGSSFYFTIRKSIEA